MSIQSEINRITQLRDEQSTLITTQETTIDSIITALEGKASGITPSGTMSITSNGTYDVTNYASASVNVSGGGSGGSVETGTLTLVANVNVGTSGYLKAYYTDEDMNIQTITINKGNAESITCVLNTPIVLEAQYGILDPDYEFVLSGCDYIVPSHEFQPYEIDVSGCGTPVFALPIYLTSSSGSFTMKIYE